MLEEAWGLYPATLEGEAKAWQWSMWAAQEIDRGVNIWSLHAVRLPPEDRNPTLLAEALKVIAPPFRVLDGTLADRPYLLGDDFTVADLNVAAVISRAIDMDLAESPRLAGWLKCCPSGRKRSITPAGGGGRRGPGRDHAADRAAQPAVIPCLSGTAGAHCFAPFGLSRRGPPGLAPRAGRANASHATSGGRGLPHRAHFFLRHQLDGFA